MSDKPIEEMSFEEAVKELETIVQQLEQGNVPLEESLESFQRGIKLSEYCKQKLQNAEETVTKIANKDGEEVDFQWDETNESTSER